MQDIDEAIKLNKEALLICSEKHLHRPMLLHNLAGCLQTCYQRSSNIEDLDQAIQLNEEALSLCPPGHPERTMSLNSLAVCLHSRFLRHDDIEDLMKAIRLHQEALLLLTPEHTGRLLAVFNLANCLRILCYKQGNIQFLDESIQCLRQAKESCNPHHPMLAHLWSHLAMYSSERNQILNSPDDSSSITHLFEKATNHQTASLQVRFKSSLQWVTKETGPSQLHAYQKSLQVADQYILVRASISSRHQILSEIPQSLALDAVACAVDLGEMERAVELFEQGRTMLWSQMARYRASLDVLRVANVELSEEFEKLSKLLEASTITSSRNILPQHSVEMRHISIGRLAKLGAS
ncbi:hypothetical protein FRC02_007913 [Tulasnella sp. 418]|nr:hypothetical protein FRC02_007913 [Tulasnella sp. 418]